MKFTPETAHFFDVTVGKNGLQVSQGQFLQDFANQLNRKMQAEVAEIRAKWIELLKPKDNA